jgi:hypothetical protein
MTRPLIRLAVRLPPSVSKVFVARDLHRIDEMRPAVLQCNRIPVVMKHFHQKINGVRVVRQIGFIDDPEGVELHPQCAFGDDELAGVCAVKAVHAICSNDSALEGDLCFGTVVEEARCGEDVFGYGL